MGKNKSLLQFRGSVGNLSFYDVDGDNMVRTKGGVEKDRIMKDADFERTRENMSEFGGAAKVGKAFRMCFAESAKKMGEKYLTGHVTGVMKKINSLGTGLRGRRTFDIVLYSDLLKGFEFNRIDPFSSMFFAPSDPITFNANRDVATWNIPVFDTKAYVTAPIGSTHFKLVLSVGILSNYAYDPGTEAYEPTEDALDTLHGFAESAEIPIGGLTGAPINLSVDLGVGSALPADVAVFAATGIIFYQQINGQLYMLATNNAMRVDSVG
jgi:hypothetical protein